MNRGRPAEKGAASEPAPKRARGGKGRAGSGAMAMEGAEGGGGGEGKPQALTPILKAKEVQDVVCGWVDGRGAYAAVLQLYALGPPLEPSAPLLKTLWACLEHEKAHGPRVRGLSALLQCYPSLFEHMVGYHVQQLLLTTTPNATNALAPSASGEGEGSGKEEARLRVLSKYCWAHLNTLLSLHNSLTHALTHLQQHATNGSEGVVREGVRVEVGVLLEDATRKRYGKHSPLRTLLKAAALQPSLLLPLLCAFTATTGSQDEDGGDGVPHLQRLWTALSTTHRHSILHNIKWTPDTLLALAPLAASRGRDSPSSSSSELPLLLKEVCGLGLEGVMQLAVGVLRSQAAHQHQHHQASASADGGAGAQAPALLLVALASLAPSSSSSSSKGLGQQGDGLSLVCSKLVGLLLDKDDSLNLHPQPRSALSVCGPLLLGRLLQALLTSGPLLLYQGREREVLDLGSRVGTQLAHAQQRHPTETPQHPTNTNNSSSSSTGEEGVCGLGLSLGDASLCMAAVDWAVGLAVEVSSLLTLSKALEEVGLSGSDREEMKREHERRLAGVVERAATVLLTVASVSPILPQDWLLPTLDRLCNEERFYGPLVTSQAQHAACLDDCVLSRPQRLLTRLKDLARRLPAFYTLISTQQHDLSPTAATPNECVVCYEPGALLVSCSRAPQPCLNSLCASCLWRKLFGPEPAHSFSCVLCRGSSALSIYRLPPATTPVRPSASARPLRPPHSPSPQDDESQDDGEDEDEEEQHEEQQREIFHTPHHNPRNHHTPQGLPQGLPEGLAQVLQLAASASGGGGSSVVLHGDGPPPDLLRLFAQLGPPPINMSLPMPLPMPGLQVRRQQGQGQGGGGGGRCPHGGQGNGNGSARLNLNGNGPPLSMGMGMGRMGMGLPHLGLAAIRLEVQQEDDNGLVEEEDDEEEGDEGHEHEQGLGDY